jgi:hypothetical protein
MADPTVTKRKYDAALESVRAQGQQITRARRRVIRLESTLAWVERMCREQRPHSEILELARRMLDEES